MGNLETFQLAPTNVEQAEAWDGDEGSYWAAHADVFDRAVAHFHDELMRVAGIESDSVVLDIGCGTGQTTRDAARLAPSGRAAGIDLSSAMLQVARTRAEREGVHNVTFEQGDAQVHPFPAGSFDVAISRTGTMFFGDLPTGFSNIASALRPGGRLAMVAWQPISENEWFREVFTSFAAGRNFPLPPPEAPSPFSLADPDGVRRLLTTAGFDDVELLDLHRPMWFAPDAEAGTKFVHGLQGWMLEGLDEATRHSALDALYASMRRHESERGVEYASAMWLTTATRRA